MNECAKGWSIKEAQTALPKRLRISITLITATISCPILGYFLSIIFLIEMIILPYNVSVLSETPHNGNSLKRKPTIEQRNNSNKKNTHTGREKKRERNQERNGKTTHIKHCEWKVNKAHYQST